MNRRKANKDLRKMINENVKNNKLFQKKVNRCRRKVCLRREIVVDKSGEC